jgi:DNA-binding IscR family transcriptional regulator
VLACLRAAASNGVTLVVAEHDRASLSRLATTTTELRRADLVDTAPGAAPA